MYARVLFVSRVCCHAPIRNLAVFPRVGLFRFFSCCDGGGVVGREGTERKKIKENRGPVLVGGGACTRVMLFDFLS